MRRIFGRKKRITPEVVMRFFPKAGVRVYDCQSSHQGREDEEDEEEVTEEDSSSSSS